MRKCISVGVLLFLCTCYAYGQQVSISGQLTDNEQNAFGGLEVYFSNLHRQASVFTDTLGSFKLVLPEKGRYLFQVKQGALVLVYHEIVVNGDTSIHMRMPINAGRVAGVTQLEDIMVTAGPKQKLLERKIDRLVFNVANSVYAIGGDAMDALKVAPNVRVMDNKISMVGKSGLSIMINQRALKLEGDDLIEYLKTIRAEDIKSIEVITTPPAQFEASGNSGIININLKKMTADSWDASVTGSYQQATYHYFDESARVRYNQKGLSINGGVRHTDGTSLYRTDEENINYSDKYYSAFNDARSKVGDNLGFNGGIDYDFNKRFSAGADYIFRNNDIRIDEKNEAFIYASDSYLLRTLTDRHSGSRQRNSNGHFAYKLDSLGSNILFNTDVLHYYNDMNNTFATRQYNDFVNYAPDSYYSANTMNQRDIKSYTVQIDVEQKLKSLALSYGGKLSYSKTKSEIAYYDISKGTPVREENRSDLFDYDENIQALYFSANSKWKKWEWKAGLRMEHADTRGYSHSGSETSTDYFKLFPSVYVSYTINDAYSINTNYSKRIQRPGYSMLNPFVRYINQYNTSSGNPFLKPYFTDNIELGMHYKDYWIHTFYFSRSDNVFDQIEHLSDGSINMATRVENYYRDIAGGITETFNIHPVNRWEHSIMGTVYYRDVHSHIPQTGSNYSGWSASVETTNSFTLNKNKTCFVSLEYWYQLPEYSAINRMNAYSALSIGFKALLLKKKLTVSITADDLLKTQEISNISYFNNTPIYYSNYEDRRGMRLSVRYAFGKSKAATRSIKFSNEEEKSRAW